VKDWLYIIPGWFKYDNDVIIITYTQTASCSGISDPWVINNVKQKIMRLSVS